MRSAAEPTLSSGTDIARGTRESCGGAVRGRGDWLMAVVVVVPVLLILSSTPPFNASEDKFDAVVVIGSDRSGSCWREFGDGTGCS